MRYLQSQINFKNYQRNKVYYRGKNTEIFMDKESLSRFQPKQAYD